MTTSNAAAAAATDTTEETKQKQPAPADETRPKMDETEVLVEALVTQKDDALTDDQAHSLAMTGEVPEDKELPLDTGTLDALLDAAGTGAAEGEFPLDDEAQKRFLEGQAGIDQMEQAAKGVQKLFPGLGFHGNDEDGKDQPKTPQPEIYSRKALELSAKFQQNPAAHAQQHIEDVSRSEFNEGEIDSIGRYIKWLLFLAIIVLGVSAVALFWSYKNDRAIDSISTKVGELETKVDGQTKAVTDAATAAKASQDATAQAATAALASQDAASASAIRAGNAQSAAELLRNEASQSAAAALASQDAAIQAATVSGESAQTAKDLVTAAQTAVTEAKTAADRLGNANARIGELEKQVKALKEADAATTVRISSQDEVLKATSARIEDVDKKVTKVEFESTKAREALDRVSKSPNGLFKKSVPKSVKDDIGNLLKETFSTPDPAAATTTPPVEVEEAEDLLIPIGK